MHARWTTRFCTILATDKRSSLKVWKSGIIYIYTTGYLVFKNKNKPRKILRKPVWTPIPWQIPEYCSDGARSGHILAGTCKWFSLIIWPGESWIYTEVTPWQHVIDHNNNSVFTHSFHHDITLLTKNHFFSFTQLRAFHLMINQQQWNMYNEHRQQKLTSHGFHGTRTMTQKLLLPMDAIRCDRTDITINLPMEKIKQNPWRNNKIWEDFTCSPVDKILPEQSPMEKTHEVTTKLGKISPAYQRIKSYQTHSPNTGNFLMGLTAWQSTPWQVQKISR